MSADEQRQVTHGAESSVVMHPQYGRIEVRDPVRGFWRSREGRLGLPVGGQRVTEVGGKSLEFVPFENGAVFLDLETGVPFEILPNAQEILDRVHGIYGSWDTPFEAGVVGVHAVLLHTNHVLLFTYSSKDTIFPTVDGEWSLLDLTSKKQIVNGEPIGRNLFCAGQCLLGDGRVLVVGGERNYHPDVNPQLPHDLNQKSVYVYHPEQRAWDAKQDMTERRWYPTVATVSSNAGIAFGGDYREYRDPSTPGLPPQATANGEYVSADGPRSQAKSFGPGFVAFDDDGGRTAQYPFVYVLPDDGKTLVHYRDRSYILPRGSFEFPINPSIRPEGLMRCTAVYGTSVMLPLRPSSTPPYAATIMVMGGPITHGGKHPRTCSVLRTGVADPQWRSVAAMKEDRNYCDSVLLPDGKVLVVNGCKYDKNTADPVPRFRPELYDPATDTWWPKPLAAAKNPRLYHSTALLLPDGTVLVGGTDRILNEKSILADIRELERFSPPYLFAGPPPVNRWTPREIAYDSTFELAANDVGKIASVAVIRNGSCTHSFNSDQRFIQLPILSRIARKRWVVPGLGCGTLYRTFHSEGLGLRAPPNSFVAPPGYYMLFLLSDQGVPAHAVFVRFVGRASLWTLVGRVTMNVLRNVFDMVFRDRGD